MSLGMDHLSTWSISLSPLPLLQYFRFAKLPFLFYNSVGQDHTPCKVNIPYKSRCGPVQRQFCNFGTVDYIFEANVDLKGSLIT